MFEDRKIVIFVILHRQCISELINIQLQNGRGILEISDSFIAAGFQNLQFVFELVDDHI